MKKSVFACLMLLLASLCSAQTPPGGYGPSIGGNSSSSTAAPTWPIGTDSGSVTNAYIVNPTPAVTLNLGQTFRWTTTRGNTGATTINASGTGAQPLTDFRGNALTATGEINSGITYVSTWDGSEWLTNVRAGLATLQQNASPVMLATPILVAPQIAPNGGSNDNPMFWLAAPFLNAPQNYREMFVISAHGSSGCAGGCYEAYGFDGDGFAIFAGNPIAFTVPSALVQGNWAYNQNDGSVSSVAIAVTPGTVKTSGLDYTYKNSTGPVLFGVDHVTGQPSTLNTCAVNSVSPAACGSSWLGSFVVPTTTTSYTVNTTAVNTHSRIFLFPHTDTRDLPGSPTCTVPAITAEPVVSATSVGVSFTISIASTTGQTCWDYAIFGT